MNLNILNAFCDVLFIQFLIVTSISAKFIVDRSFKPSGFGQPSSVAVNSEGQVYIFHRGDRTWDSDTFDFNNVFSHKEHGPIAVNTLLIVSHSGEHLGSTGASLFYLPHGLTVDHEDNLWFTDVALHQIFKYPPLSKNLTLNKPLMIFGEALIPGSDSEHFCKPTSVAVCQKTGDFFIADGYCNSRIVKYDRQGNRLMHWGRPLKTDNYGRILASSVYSFLIPHSLDIDTRRGHLLVADRENSRIAAFSIATGLFAYDLKMQSPVYGIAYCNHSDEIHAVVARGAVVQGVGLIYSLTEKNITSIFVPPSNQFESAHEIAMAPDGFSSYVVELKPFSTWKFILDDGKTENKLAINDKLEYTGELEKKTDEVTGLLKLESPKQPIPVPVSGFEASFITGNEIAISTVCAVVLLSLLLIGCHILKKTGDYKRYEMKELILDDDD